MPFPEATWDELAMGRPQAPGMSYEEPTMLLRSTYLDAEPLYVKVAEKRSSRLEAEVQMNAAQWEFFREFFDVTLRRGMAWFSMVIYVGEPRTRTVHLDSYEATWLADDLCVLRLSLEVAR